MEKPLTIDTLSAFAKRRGFVYQSSEIYGGMSAVYDYGHYGILLKNNIQQAWWKEMVLERDDMVGLDSAIFMHPMTWKASGHVDSFNEAQIDCKTCKFRMRADHLLEKFGYDLDRAPIEEINKIAEQLKAEKKLKCEKCGGSDLTEARNFNQLIKTNFGTLIGSIQDLKDEDVVYPRGETCQGIYLNYKNVIDTMRVKLPFGIAQVGKAFRNEIVARQYVFRTREFEQMEMQYFLHPSIMEEKFAYWKEKRWNWYLNVVKLSADKLRWKEHVKLAHYAKAAFDIEFNYRTLGGFKEMEGVHQRGDWDLSQHAKYSGKQLDYFDPATNERFVPNIMETSVGLNRIFLAVLDSAYTEEDLGEGKTRTVLKIAPSLAPIKVAVFPLQKDVALKDMASNIYRDLKKEMTAEFDDSGNIGKMYRRQDEIGTPFCVTVDYESQNDNSVTVRNRDTMLQERVKIAELKQYISTKLVV
jgi:glycyl-tRNA synthetase